MVAKARFLDKVDARRALVVIVARVGGGVVARVGSAAGKDALGRVRPTRHRGVQDLRTAVAGKLLETRLQTPT